MANNDAWPSSLWTARRNRPHSASLGSLTGRKTPTTRPDRKLLIHEIAWAGRAAEVWHQAVRRDGQYRQATLGLCNCLGLLGAAHGVLFNWYKARRDQIEVDVRAEVDWSDPAQATRQYTRRILNHKEFQDINTRILPAVKGKALRYWNQAKDRLQRALEDDPDCAQYRRALELVRRHADLFAKAERVEVPRIP